MPATAILQTAASTPFESDLSRGSVPHDEMEAFLQEILSLTPVPLTAPEICQRMEARDAGRDWQRLESSLRAKMAKSPWIVRLKSHGYWHKGRDYPHAGWAAEAQCPVTISANPKSGVADLRQQLLRLHGNWSELGCRHRRQLVQVRLPQLWVYGGCSMEELLDLTLRAVLEIASHPLNTEDFRVEARKLGAPKTVMSLVTYRFLKTRWWADTIRNEGFWRLDRPAPEGMASPEQQIVETARALLEESRGEFLTAEHLLSQLAQKGIFVSFSEADKCAVLRKHLKQIEGVEARSQRGFRMPKSRTKLRAPNWSTVQAMAGSPLA